MARVTCAGHCKFKSDYHPDSVNHYVANALNSYKPLSSIKLKSGSNVQKILNDQKREILLDLSGITI